MENTIAADDLAPGAIIRFTNINNLQYLSIRDYIMHMCEKDNKYASDVWMDLSVEKKSEVSEFLRSYKFPGRGQQEQPVITFPGAIKLAMFLPGENAKRNRSVMTKILIRYFAGDKSLIQEIEANAQSDAPVAQMARGALAVEPSRKRSIDDLEIEERMVNVEQQQLKILQDVTNQYTALCNPTMMMDERAKLLLKDRLLNFVVRSQPALLAPEAAQDTLPFLTISDVVNGLGYRFSTTHLKSAGMSIRKAYIAKYNEPPSKHSQMVEGAVRQVNTYHVKDRQLLEDAIHEHAEYLGLSV
jgi:hypothetical protein